MKKELLQFVYSLSIPVLWLAWGGYWLLSSKNVYRAIRREPSTSRAIHLALVAAAFGLIAVPALRAGLLGWHWLPRNRLVFFFGVAVLLAGFAFACWARHHLGRYWSAAVTVKEGHALIQSGPYSFVRHPIYTGFIMGMAGTAIALAETRGILAVVVLTVAYLRKIRIEEKWLIERFGQTYLDYKKNVKALIPFVL